MSVWDQLTGALALTNFIAGVMLLHRGFKVGSYAAGIFGYVLMTIGAFGIVNTAAEQLAR